MIYSRILTFLHGNPIAQLLFATLCGAIIGIEREVNGKPAGVRTCSLVAMSTCALTILTQLIPPIYIDRGHIAANIVQGLGFLCAGTIITNRDKVIGLTTAAAVWAVAAIGLSVGFSQLRLAVEVTLLTVSIMFGLGYLERLFVSKIEVLKKRRAK